MRLPAGKFKVQKMTGGEIIDMDVNATYVLDSAWATPMFSLKTPTNRSVGGIVLDFENCKVSVLTGSVQMQKFNDKMKDVQLNLQQGISRDMIHDFLDMSLVHPVIAELNIDDSTEDDMTTVTSSGPLMYQFSKDNVGTSAKFSFEDRSASMDIPMARAKRRRTSQI